MLKSNIDVFFGDVISLLAQDFIISFNKAYKGGEISFCDMTVPSKSNVPSL